MQAEEFKVCVQHPKHCAMTKMNVEILLVLLVATICLFSKITVIEVQDVHKID